MATTAPPAEATQSVLDVVQGFLDMASGFVWGPYLLIPLLLGTGLFLSVMLRFMPLLRIGKGFSLAFEGRQPSQAAGEITPFQALTTALSATVGTGNIAGVATAIFLGGPGAVFWMWITAILGMATKYAEAVLAVTYREERDGRFVGGPMYYIRNGLGANFAWLGAAFAFFAMIAAFGIGNMVQANSVAAAFDANFGVPNWITGAVMAVLTFAVIIGGLSRIASIAEFLVPAMAVFYVGGALIVLLLNAPQVPGAIALIFEDAFTGTAAAGGFAGAAVWAAMRFGVARGIFSNESGLGSAAIAHAAARTDNPVRQGTIAMMGTFIDTIIVCTMTALVILTIQLPVTAEDGTVTMIPAWTSGLQGAALSTAAFGQGLWGAQWVISIGLIVFAFTTVMGWSVYGERSAEYLFGSRAILPYRMVWVAALFVGAVVKLNLVWTFSDVMNGLMALPNLVALLLLSGTVLAITREGLARERAEAQGTKVTSQAP